MTPRVRGLGLSLLLTLVACRSQPPGQSAEYQAARAELERVLSETMDHDFVDPRFDAVLAKLRAVPEPDHALAAAMADDMEKKRAARKAELRALEGSVEASLKSAPPAAEVQPYAPSYGSGRSGGGGGAERGLVGGGQGLVPAGAASASDRPTSFDRAAEEARRNRLADEAKRERDRARAERLDTSMKMEKRLDEKASERMNEEWDPSKWNCNQLTGRCTSRVEVTAEEVKDPAPKKTR